jgi:hypothetical protein
MKYVRIARRSFTILIEEPDRDGGVRTAVRFILSMPDL